MRAGFAARSFAAAVSPTTAAFTHTTGGSPSRRASRRRRRAPPVLGGLRPGYQAIEAIVTIEPSFSSDCS